MNLNYYWLETLGGRITDSLLLVDSNRDYLLFVGREEAYLFATFGCKVRLGGIRNVDTIPLQQRGDTLVFKHKVICSFPFLVEYLKSCFIVRIGDIFMHRLEVREGGTTHFVNVFVSEDNEYLGVYCQDTEVRFTPSSVAAKVLLAHKELF